MTENEYLQNILARERVDVSSTSPLRGYAGVILPHLRAWAGDHIREVSPSGSFAKGTAVKSGTDIDLFISLSHTLTATLENIYTTLFNRMNQAGFKARRQNVSIGVRVDGHDVDLVPARRQDARARTIACTGTGEAVGPRLTLLPTSTWWAIPVGRKKSVF